MSNTKTITITRGNNIGHTIIEDLKQSNLYRKVTTFGMSFERKPKEGIIVVSFKYKFDI